MRAGAAIGAKTFYIREVDRGALSAAVGEGSLTKTEPEVDVLVYLTLCRTSLSSAISPHV